MKKIIGLFICLLAMPSTALQPLTLLNASLRLSVTDDGSPPKDWLKDHKPRPEATIPITATFDVGQPYVITITDAYAKNGYCGEQQPVQLFYINFDPSIKSNMKKFKTYIRAPCVSDNHASLVLYIRAARSKNYRWTTRLPVYPGYGK